MMRKRFQSGGVAGESPDPGELFAQRRAVQPPRSPTWRASSEAQAGPLTPASAKVAMPAWQAAAAVLFAADRHALDHCLAAHLSPEPGHRLLLERLGMRPLLDLGMRLGEG